VLGFSAAPPDRRGDVELDARSARRGWYFHTTLWAFSPRYRGPLLIRGRRLDRPQQVRFHTGSYPRRELRVPPGHAPQGHWSYGVSSTMLRAPGCYGLQIDGLTFSRAVVFRAVLPAARVTAGRRPRGDPR
jgi:hypothetical protein